MEFLLTILGGVFLGMAVASGLAASGLLWSVLPYYIEPETHEKPPAYFASRGLALIPVCALFIALATAVFRAL